MSYRLTITAAIAVVLASFSLFTVIAGAGWLYAGWPVRPPPWPRCWC